MDNFKANYFLINELAKSQGISRELLHFYDRKGLFSPCIISDNGYRYYALLQFFELQIISGLRKIHIPLPVIKNYLEKKEYILLLKILETRNAEIISEIEKLAKQKETIEKMTCELLLIDNIRLETLEVSNQKEEFLILSKQFDKHSSVKKNYETFFDYQNLVNKSSCNISMNFGLIVDRTLFLTEAKPQAKRMFLIDNENQLTSETVIVKAAGLYLTLYLKGKKKETASLARKLFKEYVKTNHLEIVSDIYVYTIQNYWTTNNQENYIFKYSAQIKKLVFV
jgi:DNA-binding transcriptional MerR regulator